MAKSAVSRIRRLKRMAHGEGTALVLGIAGGALLAAVMLRGNATAGREAREQRAGDRRGVLNDGGHDVPRFAAHEQAAAKRRPNDHSAAQLARDDPFERDAADVDELEALPDAPDSQRADATDPEPPADGRRPKRARNEPPETSHRPTESARPLIRSRDGPSIDENSGRRDGLSREPVATDDAGAGQRTLGYWTALGEIINREAAMRVAPANLTAANAGGFVEARVRAGRFAADAIRRLDFRGVDREAASHGADLAAWYDEEARLAAEASSLLGSSDFAARRGAAGKSWKNGEELHRQKCDELNRRSADLQRQLSHRYSRTFAPLP